MRRHKYYFQFFIFLINIGRFFCYKSHTIQRKRRSNSPKTRLFVPLVTFNRRKKQKKRKIVTNHFPSARHNLPWPRATRRIFGPNTSAMVVDVDNCVRMNPKRYFMSGPACGKIIKLRRTKEKVGGKEKRENWNTKFEGTTNKLTETQSWDNLRVRLCRWHTKFVWPRCTLTRRVERCSRHGCPRQGRIFHQEPSCDPTSCRRIVWISVRDRLLSGVEYAWMSV